MRWIFVIAGIVCVVIAIVIAINLVDFMHQGDKIKELQQKINNTDFFKPAQFSLKLAFAQQFYNTTTGNYGDDPNNPNNAENIIIKYCIDHADLVATGQNVVQTLVHAGLVPIFYDGKTCSDVQALHKESQFNQELQESKQSLLDSLASDDPKDDIAKELFNNLPKDVQDKILKLVIFIHT